MVQITRIECLRGCLVTFRGMIEVISKLQEAVSKAAVEADKEEASAAEAVDTLLAADSGALAEAEVEAAVKEDRTGPHNSSINTETCFNCFLY